MRARSRCFSTRPKALHSLTIPLLRRLGFPSKSIDEHERFRHRSCLLSELGAALDTESREGQVATQDTEDHVSGLSR